MKDLYGTFLERHKKFWTKKHLRLLVVVFLFFLFAMTVQSSTDLYVGQLSGVSVGDLILSNIPTYNIDIFVVQGALALTALIIALVLWKPKYILFTMAAIAMFIIIRSFFISLTHLGVDPHQVKLDTDSIGFGLYNLLFNTKGDFFFSGHTGLPFLMGLVFYGERRWREIFFVISLIMGVSVLLGHIHYSIDVFAAPFMAFGIYNITKIAFPKLYEITQESL